MSKHQLAVRRHDPLSLISIHKDAHCHRFKFSNVHVLDRAITKYLRKFLEAWYSTSDSINHYIELYSIYLSIRLEETTRTLQNASHMVHQTPRWRTRTH